MTWVVTLGLVLLVGAELAARFALGLGDPPLYVLDPRIEYMLAPSQDCRRFGNAFRTNRWGMRSDDFPDKKSTPNELRVMVIGDSIVNGGARVDQSDLATAVLQRELAAKLRRPVTVGNISAGSWGPVNQLAYLEKHGLFEADVVVLVLNTEDATDVPGMELIGPQWPRRKPVLALQEIGERLLPRIFLPLGGNGPPEQPPIAHTTTRDQDESRTREAVEGVVRLGQRAGARVIVVRFATRDELSTSPDRPPPHFMLPRGAEHGDTTGAFRAAVHRGESLFQPDGVHLTPAGQHVLGGVLADLIVNAATPENQKAAPSAIGP